MIKPITAFWSKQFYADSLGSRLLKLFQAIAVQLQDIYAKEGVGDEAEKKGILFADDCLVAFRNLGFLEDPLFIRAVGPRAQDPVLMARVWRLWVTSWSLSACWNINGDVLDLGTYNGKSFFTTCKYALLFNKAPKKNGSFIASDLFEDPPKEAKKTDHGPDLHQRVTLLMQTLLPESIVVKGFLPDCLGNLNIHTIAWCQIDLNSAEADLHSFMSVYPKLSRGAHVIFDDYGSNRYPETQKSLDVFLQSKGERILELPTMQGLFIKS